MQDLLTRREVDDGRSARTLRVRRAALGDPDAVLVVDETGI
jgi:hypothetical protein